MPRTSRKRAKTLGDFAALALLGAVGAVATEIGNQLDEETKKKEARSEIKERIPKKVKGSPIEAEYKVIE